MKITINLPDNLSLTESDLRREVAIAPDAPSIQILVTPDFQGQLRKLAKRYCNIRSDLQPLFDDLESGNCPGDRIPDTTYTVFKVRVKNSDIQKGKSSGYRVIYQLR